MNLELGPVREIGAFPHQRYRLSRAGSGFLIRDREELRSHEAAKAEQSDEVQRRLAAASKKAVRELALEVTASGKEPSSLHE
jgi:hypothetical protein